MEGRLNDPDEEIAALARAAKANMERITTNRELENLAANFESLGKADEIGLTNLGKAFLGMGKAMQQKQQAGALSSLDLDALLAQLPPEVREKVIAELAAGGSVSIEIPQSASAADGRKKE